MKKRSSLLFTILSVLLLWGCYPQGADFTEDYDVVYTNYNNTYDFASKGTFAIPDKIVKITGNLVEGDAPTYIPDAVAIPILNRIKSNMTSLGWTQVAVSANPDILFAPASWETTTVYYWYDYWYWWYGGYYPYWGGYPPVYYSSYTTGTLLMKMIDPDDLAGTGDPITEWTGALNGILTGGYNAARINPLIDQAFKQSPYLKTN